MATFLAPRIIADHKALDDQRRDIKRVNQYALVDTLGQSSQAKVYLALDVDRNLPYAAKAIAVGGMRNSGPALEREIRLLRRFDHPHIIKLHEVLHAKRQAVVYLILEWAPHGSLAANGGLPERTVAAIFRQICQGLSAIHGQGLVHHDIKPSNILLFTDGTAKLADFGVGHSLDSADTVIATPAYQAPEFFDESADIVLDPIKEDIWSMGVSIYEAAFGALPFTGANVYEISWNVLHSPLPIPAHASGDLRDLLEKMLRPDPSKRISLGEVQAHRFLAEAPEKFELPTPPRAPPKVGAHRSMAYVVANVCDDTYTFVKKQLSASSPVSLYGFF
jgi:serine/threonine-protein kinase 11